MTHAKESVGQASLFYAGNSSITLSQALMTGTNFLGGSFSGGATSAGAGPAGIMSSAHHPSNGVNYVHEFLLDRMAGGGGTYSNSAVYPKFLPGGGTGVLGGDSSTLPSSLSQSKLYARLRKAPPPVQSRNFGTGR